MKVKRAYQYRAYPTPEQAQNFACTFGCTRFVYNWALSTRTRAYFDHGLRLYTKHLSAAITAYTNFFEGRADSPTFKKKHGDQCATYTDNAFTFRNGHLILAKQQEPLPMVWSRPLPDGARPSSVTVSKDRAGRYFVSLLVEEEIALLAPVDRAIGIDLGLKSFLVTSDGESIANPKYYVRHEKNLAKAQRKHARKKKGSKNREKARRKVARLHARITDTRRDFQQQTSTRLIRENQVICLETLNARGMLKNHCLAKAISDVGWGEFTRQLEYKARWYGRTVVRVDRWYPSSKTCSACGHVLETLTLDVREWVCPACGAAHDRDHTAAKNVLTEGLSALNACGGNIRLVDSKGVQAVPVEAGTLHCEVGNPLPFQARGGCQLARMDAQLSRLTKLVGDLLDVSKMQA